MLNKYFWFVSFAYLCFFVCFLLIFALSFCILFFSFLFDFGCRYIITVFVFRSFLFTILMGREVDESFRSVENQWP